VFDEAHHLTAHRTGGKVRKAENYKLAEALKDHARDLLLLSATPHQGNHFQFWMLAQLLNPTLFGSPEDMLENRHRLNTVMFRRTKADACQPDGSPLFARRWVHTESFLMNQEERLFYEKLREYLEEGFDLARRQGNQGRALGFLMAIFQKIAASSFAAVRRTLKRRLLMLTLHEAFLRDKELDIEGRERLTEEARELIHEEFGLQRDSIGRSEVDRVLADLKYRLVKKLDEEALEKGRAPVGTRPVRSGRRDYSAASFAASGVNAVSLAVRNFGKAGGTTCGVSSAAASLVSGRAAAMSGIRRSCGSQSVSARSRCASLAMTGFLRWSIKAAVCAPFASFTAAMICGLLMRPK